MPCCVRARARGSCRLQRSTQHRRSSTRTCDTMGERACSAARGGVARAGVAGRQRNAPAGRRMRASGGHHEAVSPPVVHLLEEQHTRNTSQQHCKQRVAGFRARLQSRSFRCYACPCLNRVRSHAHLRRVLLACWHASRGRSTRSSSEAALRARHQRVDRYDLTTGSYLRVREPFCWRSGGGGARPAMRQKRRCRQRARVTRSSVAEGRRGWWIVGVQRWRER